MNLLRYIRMVLWGYFGVRRRRGATDELSRAHPLALLATALALAGGFVALLLWAATTAVATLG